MAHIGLDLDNTLVDYEPVFAPVAVAMGLLPADLSHLSKIDVRTHLRGLPDGETLWMRLQGQVYGRHLPRARLYDGVADFLTAMKARGARISIVSHKTRYGHFDPDQVNLWDAMMQWLENQGFFRPTRFAMDRSQVFFEETREAKLARIAALEIDLFIDDLPEVLLDPAFPARTQALWFADGQPQDAGEGLPFGKDWAQLTEVVETRLFKRAEGL